MDKLTSNLWSEFKNKPPRLAKGIKISALVGGTLVVTGGVAVIGFVFGYEPKRGNNNSRAHYHNLKELWTACFHSIYLANS